MTETIIPLDHGDVHGVEPTAHAAELPTVGPQLIGSDTWLIPSIVASGPAEYLFVNSMLIRGRETVVVDTGAPLHRDHWYESITSLVDPEDIRWVFLSHDDGDHIGNMSHLLERAPNATVVTNFFSVERAGLEPDRALPIDRMVWLEPGESLDLPDRRLHLFRPPIFDGPTTRGLYDDRTGVMWAVDSFAALTVESAYHAGDVPPDLFAETFTQFNSMVSPWHAWLDPAVYARHVDEVESFGATTIASAHGPILSGPFVAGAFERVRAMAGAPIAQTPGPEVLDEMVAALTAVAATSAG